MLKKKILISVQKWKKVGVTTSVFYDFGQIELFFSPNFVEIEDLPPTIQEQLYSELMDRDAQKELEEEAAIINWSEEVRVKKTFKKIFFS